MKDAFFELKKGSIGALRGNVVVYARVKNPEAAENRDSPVHDMARNGILAATGDYRTQHNLEDFLKKELGITLADLSNPENASIAGLPENINPDFLKKKIESLKGFEDLIPTPAKLTSFDSEQEILTQEADIFYLGEFEKIAGANLAVNALPILYQAVYREQVRANISQEIEKLLSIATLEVRETGHYLDDTGHIENKILTEFLPEIIYNRLNGGELKKWTEQFKSFMTGYKYPLEIEKIISLTLNNVSGDKEIQHLIELYIKRIAAFAREDYKMVGTLKTEIALLEENMGKISG